MSVSVGDSLLQTSEQSWNSIPKEAKTNLGLKDNHAIDMQIYKQIDRHVRKSYRYMKKYKPYTYKRQKEIRQIDRHAEMEKWRYA